MTDLVSRLLEAIGETERIASNLCSRVNPGTDQWTADFNSGMQVRNARGHLVVQHSWPNEIEHIAHNDPASVLRRCAADRRRLERHAPAEPGIGHFGSARFRGTDTQICTHCSHDGDWGATVWPCPDVVDLMDCYGLTDNQEGECSE